MTVSELIELLKQQPQDLLVIYSKFSENVLMEANEIYTVTACTPRPDGWVQNLRPDRAPQTYLSFPGN